MISSLFKYTVTLVGTLSYRRRFYDKEYICLVEEYAIYPVLGDERTLDRKEVVEHFGILASKFTNVFLNETNCFPEQEEFDTLSVSELLDKRAAEQRDMLSVIFRHYTLNDDEVYVIPYYERIIDLFQYPNVCAMVQWLGEYAHREKCVELIEALLKMP